MSEQKEILREELQAPYPQENNKEHNEKVSIPSGKTWENFNSAFDEIFRNENGMIVCPQTGIKAESLVDYVSQLKNLLAIQTHRLNDKEKIIQILKRSSIEKFSRRRKIK